jgi:hypothetical protein
MPRRRGIFRPRLLHVASRGSARFDEPSLVSCAGLVPAARLAEDCGLVRNLVRVGAKAGANANVKIACVVFGRLAGADRIDDLALQRHLALTESSLFSRPARPECGSLTIVLRQALRLNRPWVVAKKLNLDAEG